MADEEAKEAGPTPRRPVRAQARQKTYDETRRRGQRQRPPRQEVEKREGAQKDKARRAPTAARQIEISTLTVARIVGGRYVHDDGCYRVEGATRVFDDGG